MFRSLDHPQAGYVVIFISDVAAYRVFVYALFSVQGGGYVDWLQFELGRVKRIHKHKICCHITDKYNDIHVFTILTCNFSKEQYVLPEVDLRIEKCRSILSVLM